MSQEVGVSVPMFYRPWPHQQLAWNRRRTRKYQFYFKLWCRQAGKDTDDIQYELKEAWENPGTLGCYVGLDNVWVRSNMFEKIIDGRYHWNDFPEEYCDHNATKREITMLNNPKNLAAAKTRFIGFLNDTALIGSSYDRWTFSEASLYQPNAFQFMRPIWERRRKLGDTFFVEFNGTPRGMSNVFYDQLRTYTGEDDPDLFPGEHTVDGVTCFVDKVTIQQLMIPDPDHPGMYKRLYTDDEIEQLKSSYLREFGNLNFYYQENEVNFTTVNAGLVYLTIEDLDREGRYTSINLDTSKPVYIAFDIGSKGKATDATSAIIYQYYNNRMMVYDIYEARGKSLVECIAEISLKPYFKNIRMGILPWDSDRSASSSTPLEEARQQFPNINWHQLDKERVDRGIALVRKMLPNMVINRDHCEYLMTCFRHYEYERLEKQNDWSATPKHNVYSHMMDAMRYAVMGVNEVQYLGLNDTGVLQMPARYQMWDEPIPDPYDGVPLTFRPKQQKKESDNGYAGWMDLT